MTTFNFQKTNFFINNTPYDYETCRLQYIGNNLANLVYVNNNQVIVSNISVNNQTILSYDGTNRPTSAAWILNTTALNLVNHINLLISEKQYISQLISICKQYITQLNVALVIRKTIKYKNSYVLTGATRVTVNVGAGFLGGIVEILSVFNDNNSYCWMQGAYVRGGEVYEMTTGQTSIDFQKDAAATQVTTNLTVNTKITTWEAI